MTRISRTFWIAASVCVLCAGAALANGGNGERSRRSVRYDISVKGWGPTPTEIEAARQRVLKSAAATSALDGTNYRLLVFKSIDRADKNKNSLPPTRFRAYFYDYTNAKTFVAEGDYAGNQAISLRASDWVPDAGATGEEVQDALKIIAGDGKLGSLYKTNKIEASPGMPGVSLSKGERLINILVRDVATGAKKIYGVSFRDRKVVDYGNTSPATGNLADCGITNSAQGSSSLGTGTVQVSSKIGQQVIWEMLVVRPAQSTGGPSEGSGIEVRDVKYKGKSVLKRGHAPILNVKYLNNVCGPYRDWQDSEGYFDAPAAGSSEPVPGYRLLADGQVAKTVVESGDDTGNFQGVAIYQEDVGLGPEFILVTEMNAGWYRYIMEWRFAADGTIRPRYGFGSVANGCVCAARNHHVYWRFDFDVVNTNNDVFKVERGRKFLTPIKQETKLFRSYQTNRAILIKNSTGDEAYELVPNITDEEAYYQGDPFGSGDLWILRFAGTAASPGELDDPYSNAFPAANIDPWVSGQSLGNSDAVVWYAAHQFRDDATSLTNFDRTGQLLSGVHVVGPDLRPIRW